MTYFVTGAAGFIGSNLVDRLLADPDTSGVVGWDNFSTGQERFLTDAQASDRFRLIRGDNLDRTALAQAMAGCDFVFHFAANADVRFGTQQPEKDLQQNTVATFNVLEAARACGIKRFAFSSTGSIYGEAATIPTPEDAAFPVQTSLYGASKLAGEGMISAYAEGFGMETYIFRFVSLVGERYTHGHIFDFHRQLIEHPEWLRVLGDGTARKSYLYVQDCIDAMLHVIGRQTAAAFPHSTAIYNLGAAEYVSVSDSIGIICDELGVNPERRYTGGDRGWIGDNPFIFLDTARIRATGWKPTLSIREGIVRTLRWLQENRWVHAARGGGAAASAK